MLQGKCSFDTIRGCICQDAGGVGLSGLGGIGGIGGLGVGVAVWDIGSVTSLSASRSLARGVIDAHTVPCRMRSRTVHIRYARSFRLVALSAAVCNVAVVAGRPIWLVCTMQREKAGHQCCSAQALYTFKQKDVRGEAHSPRFLSGCFQRVPSTKFPCPYGRTAELEPARPVIQLRKSVLESILTLTDTLAVVTSVESAYTEEQASCWR